VSDAGFSAKRTFSKVRKMKRTNKNTCALILASCEVDGGQGDVQRIATFFDNVQGTDVTQNEAWEFMKALGYDESTMRRGFNLYVENL